MLRNQTPTVTPHAPASSHQAPPSSSSSLGLSRTNGKGANGGKRTTTAITGLNVIFLIVNVIILFSLLSAKRAALPTTQHSPAGASSVVDASPPLRDADNDGGAAVGSVSSSSSSLPRCLALVRTLQSELNVLKTRGGGEHQQKVIPLTSSPTSSPSLLPSAEAAAREAVGVGVVPPLIAANGAEKAQRHTDGGEGNANAVGIAQKVVGRREDAPSRAQREDSPQQQQPYLIIGMPSAPRRRELEALLSSPNDGNADAVDAILHKTILFKTLASITKEMEGSSLLQHGGSSFNSSSSSSSAPLVKVVVMNVRPKRGEHIVFEKCKALFGRQHRHWLEFIDKPPPADVSTLLSASSLSPSSQSSFSRPFSSDAHTLKRALRDAYSDREDAALALKQQEGPTENARRQTNDVVALLDVIKGTSAYYYFSEDDMAFCGNTIQAILYMIEKARRTMTINVNIGTVVVGGGDASLDVNEDVKRYFEHQRKGGSGRGGGNVGVGGEGDESVVVGLLRRNGPKEGPFAAIRCSFGLNGIIMHNGGYLTGTMATANADEDQPSPSSSSLSSSLRYPSDVGAFANYLYRYQFRRPPDHLATEFFAQESERAQRHFGGSTEEDAVINGNRNNDNNDNKDNAKGTYVEAVLRRVAATMVFKSSPPPAILPLPRKVAAFRYNVVQHLGGAASTLREEEAWSMPSCFEELVEPQVFAVEAWDRNVCGHSDLWPCEPMLMGKGSGGGGGGGGFGRLQMRTP